MQPTRTYRTRPADILSAFFLCLAAVLAGAYTPLTAVASSVASPAFVAGGIDAPGQQSSPTTPKRPFIAAEWRVVKAALVESEGKSKAALPPVGPSVPDLVAGPEHDASVRRAELSHAFHGYGARAPPASS